MVGMHFAHEVTLLADTLTLMITGIANLEFEAPFPPRSCLVGHGRALQAQAGGSMGCAYQNAAAAKR